MTKYIIKTGVSIKSFGEEMYIISPGEGYIHNLNFTAARVVELFREGFSSQQVLEKMAQEYDVEESELRKDLDEITALLCEKGILEAHE
ncbi:PqqD family protein [Myxococcota bacterium]|nr:PqqD family protein [Myxococcota bacterium]MBU1382495.1 PqqD family protein [Myxococcota bacterium]MBU1497943.1 PqqD family protein [Myxococcota bacterium]